MYNIPIGSAQVNAQAIAEQFRAFMRNPGAAVAQRLGIPANTAANPDAIIQQMLDSGAMSQSDYNRYRQVAQNLMRNPNIAQMMRR